MRNEAIRWLDEALWDYETALILHRERRYNASAFYSHQAAEKAAKALLYFINEAPWGHSVRTLLLRYFEKVGINPDQELLRCARELDRHYIPSRYPNALPVGTPHEAYDEETSRRALEASKKIVDYARKVIHGGRRE
ncbi:HEPN domain protein [Staphylothermus marinus F1]|uniref:HEPN domain protein n=1 Tax=Staphylothermus marinus (strain ATCC 43588 / DSM 3639 / JCM 9404 / F1) TaxID=399550 RepID=A3DMK9_STAMF|nr:HEPN domain-containing protein [Staphylothermus marinus]ABN69869.1 HEPN domain protein [Staphylothermus marinus F1]